jgi:hypothetical protein
MSKYNWAEMTPRQRDALVAEKVMGWAKIEYSDGTVGFWWKVPHYTTDIAAAWAVVEKMRECGINYSVHNYGDGHECVFDKEMVVFERVSSSSAPEAICLAALRALGVDV